MTPAQEAAFAAAAAGQSSSGLLLGIALIVAVFALTWLAWLALRLFDRWTRRGKDVSGVIWYVIRGAVAVSVLGWFIR